MKSSPGSVRTLMAKSVANKWILSLSSSEYRFVVSGFKDFASMKKFSSYLRSARNKSSKIGRVTAFIPDLGVKERGDSIEIWSSNVESLRKVANWAESIGLNTDFIW